MKTARYAPVLAIAFILLSTARAQGQAIDLPDLVEKAKPAIASITIYDGDSKPLGSATGFFISHDLFVTSQHVLNSEEIKSVRAAFPDGSHFYADRVISWNTHNDLAIVRLMSGERTRSYLQLSKSEPRVGEKVVVIGNPRGLGWTVSEGIVSASRESAENGYLVRRLQISADISPGSSGSPVFNLRGEVVGVIEGALADGQGLNQRLNFAIPSSYIKIEPSGARIAPPAIDFSDIGTSNDGDKSARDTQPKFQINVQVHSGNIHNGWADTGLTVRRGQRLRILATGRISLRKGRLSTPAGLSHVVDTEKLMRGEPTGALIAVVGDNNDEFIFIGAGREFVTTRAGRLFLGVNEWNLSDNTGAYSVTVEVLYW
jgi:hypothetical protein